MTKQDFLDGLRRSLSAGLEPEQIKEHIRYYSDYIDSQIRKGIAEEEVMASLGEPRWIAKTILGMEESENVTEEYVEEDTVADAKYRYFGMCALLFCTNHCFFIDDSFVAIYFYDDFCGDNDSVFEKYVSLNILRINDAYYSCN